MTICTEKKKYYGMFVKSNGKFIGKCTEDLKEENQKRFESTCVDVEFVEISRDISDEKLLEMSLKVKKENENKDKEAENEK